MVECEFIWSVYIIIVSIVLIDTWWNVNDSFLNSMSNMLGFNRYMVECELMYYIGGYRRLLVLIDTWWNVNVDYDGLVLRVEQVLIDTWWNVNEG